MKHYLSTLAHKAQRVVNAGLLMAMVALPALAQSNTYGLPSAIQDGNILHCFDWKMSDVKAEMANIAAAGFGAVQLSPLQRAVTGSDTWYDAYRPYDFAFKSSVFGSADDLKALCAEADKYGVKVVVDVVFNHVDGGSYHDSWWNSNGRTRSDGDINYGSRYSITHGQLGGAGGYPDCNSEGSDVAARGKEYIEYLKSCGVDGIRFDAAKHIALPSENCNFWSTVCSVSGLYYYGEILDNPGGDGNSLMKEYTKYMSVTDNGYGDNTRENGGIPTGGYAGWGAGTIDQSKCVYWGESHDTYANGNGASKYDSQEVVDRAYAIVACRKSEAALYLSRPGTTDGNSMKCGQKGSTHYTSKCVAEVNKFRNAMVGKADYYTVSGNVACVTRQGGGAVIVNKNGGGSVSITNGGGYVPAGTYTDQVSGNTFTVTSSTISGTVGSTGIAVVYNASSSPVTPTPTPSTGSITVYCQASSAPYLYVWTSTSVSTNGAWPGAQMTSTKQIGGKTFYYASFDESAINIIFNNGNGSQTANIEGITSDVYYVYDGNTTATVYTGDTSDGGSEGGSEGGSGTSTYYCYFKNTAGWGTVSVWAWNSDGSCTTASGWPGDNITLGSDGYYKWTAPSGKTPTSIIFSNDGASKTADLTFYNGKVYDATGATSDYTGGGNSGGDPVSGDYPATLYLIGNVNSWTCSTAIAATGDQGVYTWSNVVLPDAGGTDAGKTFFAFNTILGSNWDAVNQADRYGAQTSNASLTVGTDATVRLFAEGIDASLCYSWQTTPGTYTITVDLTQNTVTLSTSRATLIRNVKLTLDAAAPMYNILGQRVNSSYRGVVIQNGKKLLIK